MAMDQDNYLIEEVELEEPLDNIQYEEVPEDETDSESDGQDFATLLSTLKNKAVTTSNAPLITDTGPNSTQKSGISKRPVLAEDFIRNFLIRHNMKKSLQEFQHEWYEAQQKNRHKPIQEAVPDIYQENQRLENQIVKLQQEIVKMDSITGQAKGTWERLRKERDYHRMHHRRVTQEKNELYKKLKRLTKHVEEYKPVFDQMKSKYEKALKEKMLMRLDRDKIKLKYQSLEAQLGSEEEQGIEEAQTVEKPFETAELTSKKLDSILTIEDRQNPYQETKFDPVDVHKFTLNKTFKGHTMAVSRMALHPKKDIVATVSDDCTWKMWSVPSGDLVLCGEGHKEWVSDIDFHPNGHLLATTSGDGTLKVWDFLESRCTATFADHTQAVWSCAFHDGGDFVVSCSMDHTARLWDLQSERCRQTFRGHVDSVNYVTFQPYSNNICTASGDKTLSMWDLRSGLCVQTFFGHHNSINHCAFNLKANEIVSCDADGIVKLWDCRMINELTTIANGSQAATHAIFDPSGERLVIASEDASIKTYEHNGTFLSELAGHEEGVNCLLFDHGFKSLLSGSSDCTWRIWK